MSQLRIIYCVKPYVLTVLTVDRYSLFLYDLFLRENVRLSLYKVNHIMKIYYDKNQSVHNIVNTYFEVNC